MWGWGREKSQAVTGASSRSAYCVPDTLLWKPGVENLLELEWLAGSIPLVAKFCDL